MFAKGKYGMAAVALAVAIVASMNGARAQHCPPNTQPARLPNGVACLTHAQIEQLNRRQMERRQHQDALRQQQAAERQRQQMEQRQYQESLRRQQAARNRREQSPPASALPPGCVSNGRTYSCPSDMKSVTVGRGNRQDGQPGRDVAGNGVPPGCVSNGRTYSCPSDIKRVEVAPMKRVQVAPIERVEVAPMNRGASGSPGSGAGAPPSASEGAGMTQAQVDGWEFVRKNAWNGTTPEMGYKSPW